MQATAFCTIRLRHGASIGSLSWRQPKSRSTPRFQPCMTHRQRPASNHLSFRNEQRDGCTVPFQLAQSTLQPVQGPFASQALLFDCDGVLVDTEKDGHRVAFNEAFKRKGGCYPLRHAVVRSCCACTTASFLVRRVASPHGCLSDIVGAESTDGGF